MRWALLMLLISETPPTAPVVEAQGLRMLLSASGAQTMSALDGGKTGRYYDWGELVGYQRPHARRVVLLGLGGGEMLRAVRRSLPDAELLGVEVDPRVARAAVDSFHVAQFGVGVEVTDARDWVQRAPVMSADVLLVDVFDDMNIPPYFVSPGFFEECLRVVGPAGAVLMNVWPTRAARGVAKAMRRGGFSSVTAVDVGHDNTLLWAGRLSEATVPAWMMLEQRYVP